MKNLLILIAVLVCTTIAAPAFAIDSDYKQTGYYQTFIDTYVASQQQEGMVVQSRDGRKQAIVPEPQDEEKVVQQQIKDGDQKASQ